jgi:hypothetical protein
MKIFKFVGAALALANLFGSVSLFAVGDLSGGFALFAASAWVAATLVQLD